MTAKAVHPLSCVRVPKEDGVIKIERQKGSGSPQQEKLPWAEQLALDNHAVRAAKLGTEAQPAERGPRDFANFKAVARALPQRSIGGESVPAADMVEPFNQGDEMHKTPSVGKFKVKSKKPKVKQEITAQSRSHRGDYRRPFLFTFYF
jgi:hypothetical protein